MVTDPLAPPRHRYSHNSKTLRHAFMAYTTPLASGGRTILTEPILHYSTLLTNVLTLFFILLDHGALIFPGGRRQGYPETIISCTTPTSFSDT